LGDFLGPGPTIVRRRDGRGQQYKKSGVMVCLGSSTSAYEPFSTGAG
jgi:hypothetical protein